MINEIGDGQIGWVQLDSRPELDQASNQRLDSSSD